MLKKKLEALLFSSGRKMNVEELSKLAHAGHEEIQNALMELKKDYDEKQSSVMVINEGDSWKLNIREQFLSLVQKIVTETELSKTIMETLAVIAFKYPIKQSDLIKIRTNKAYDHLKELEELGYISRQKHGRTNLIKLTQKFFEYFDLQEEKLKEQFKDFGTIAHAIEEKESEIKQIKEEQKAKAEEEKKKDKEIKKEIDLLDKEGQEVPLDTYENKEAKQEKEKPEVKVIGGKLGSLNVVDEPSEKELEKERERIQAIKQEEKQEPEEKEKPKFEGLGIKTTPEMEKIIDEKVDRIIHPPKKEQESEGTKEENKDKSKTKEPKDLLEAEMEDNKKKEQE